METFIYSLGVIYCVVSCIYGSVFAYYLLSTIFSKNNYNIIQKFPIIISTSYVCMIIGFVLTLLFPLIVLLITSYTNLVEKYIISLIPTIDLSNNIIITEQLLETEQPTETEQSTETEQPTETELPLNDKEE